MWKALKPGEAPDEATLGTATAVFEEAGQPIAAGRWFVMPDGAVYFRTVDGNVQLSILPAESLRGDAYREVLASA